MSRNIYKSDIETKIENMNDNVLELNSSPVNQYLIKEEIAEVYENQKWSARKGWHPSVSRPPWSNMEGFTLYPIDEAPLKRGWVWLDEWKIDISRLGKRGDIIGKGNINPKIDQSIINDNFRYGSYDKDGWEYATKFIRYGPKRIPRGKMKWNDKTRRRKWIRTKGLQAIKNEENERNEIEKIQEGLTKIQKLRQKIEKLIRRDSRGRRDKTLQDNKSYIRKQIRFFNQRLNEVEAFIEREIIQVRVKKKLLKDLRREHHILLDLMRDIDLGFDSIDSGTDSNSNQSLNSLTLSGEGEDFNSYGSFQPELEHVGLMLNDDEKKQEDFDDDDGVFVLREDEDRQLMQKMIVQDENEIMDDILREREEEMRAINQGMHEVRELFKDLALYVEEQNEFIEEIDQNVEATHVKAEEGLDQLREANRIQKKTLCIIS